MRTLAIVVLMVSFLGCGNSQVVTNDFASFYNKYQSDEGVVSFKLPMILAKLVINESDINADAVISKMDNMLFFISEQDGDKHAKILERHLSEAVYHDLMVVKEGNKTISFKMKEVEDQSIEEVLLIISEPGNFVTICFNGEFTHEDAKKMTSSIKMDGLGDIRM